MYLFRGLKKHLLIACFAISLIGTIQSACATTVQFQTVLGDFEVNLFDKTTPKTVENFLNYVESGAYTDTVIHRAEPGFIVQGGGFEFTGSLPLKGLTQNAAVVNEPVYSNRRGTIAMAKLENKANSATSQWFFNLKDNSAILDGQNGGFTVFGQVTGNGMAIIDAMAALSRFNKDGTFSELPLRNYTAEDHRAAVAYDEDNLVMIEGIVVLNASPDTADSLAPVENTLIDSKSGGSGGGGSIGFLSILLLSVLAAARIRAMRGSRRRQSF